MTYKVIKDFTDLTDDHRVYRVGETYPHKDAKKPTKKRIEELSGKKNKRKEPLIEENKK